MAGKPRLVAQERHSGSRLSCELECAQYKAYRTALQRVVRSGVTTAVNLADRFAVIPAKLVPVKTGSGNPCENNAITR
jgi:hypothetical protein